MILFMINIDWRMWIVARKTLLKAFLSLRFEGIKIRYGLP